MADKAKGQFVNPPRTLRSKVGIGGPGAVGPEALERAEQVISGLTDDYLQWVEEDLAKLQNAFDNLRAKKNGQKENLEAIFQVAHEIKGQGGSFGYELMTVIGDQLCGFVEDREAAGPGEIEVIDLHVGALRLVIAERMRGGGGTAGAKLLNGLRQVIAKVEG